MTRTTVAWGAFLAAGAVAAAAHAGSISALVGLDDLAERIGAANVPSGFDVIVGQVEAVQGTSYGPDQSNREFDGKNFITGGQLIARDDRRPAHVRFRHEHRARHQ